LGADIIVGFPGETESEFAFLVDFIEQSPLTYLHVFAYSPRPGTAAGAPGFAWGSGSAVPDHALRSREGAAAGALGFVDSAVKAGRAARLRAIGARKDRDFRLRFLGSELEGVVIQPEGSGAEVLTANGIAVIVPGHGPARGEAVRTRITEVTDRQTRGEII
jgi:threonylcarbamoyladenosine tRNA methylthiotransferase MtaB